MYIVFTGIRLPEVEPDLDGSTSEMIPSPMCETLLLYGVSLIAQLCQ